MMADVNPDDIVSPTERQGDMLPIRHAASITLTLVLLGASLQARNWPGWRGADGQGVSDEVALPTEWAADRNVAWKAAIPGRGHSSPIVWGNRVFLTTAIEGDVLPDAKAPIHYIQEDPKKAPQAFLHPDSMGADRKHTLQVMALDLESGRVLWTRTAFEGAVFDNRHKAGSYASPTPVTDGRLVYAYFGSEGLFAYDFAGSLEWKADFGDIRTLGIGVSTSPILYKDLVIVQCDEENGEHSFIAALDARTGKQVWKTPRKAQVTWTTPVLVEVNGRTELVTNGVERIVGYDPANGKELWSAPGVESNAVHSPLVGQGLVIFTSGYPAKKVIAIRPGGTGDIRGSDRIAWTYEKGAAYVPTPILYGDLLYLLTDAGVMTALDVKTGTVRYEGGRPPEPAKFMGSPVAWGGHLYLTSLDGDTFVIKAGPKHEVVRTNTVDEPVYASLAPSQGRVLVRALGHLYCIKAA
jgi:outer membrane protein assembly factor BamB